MRWLGLLMLLFMGVLGLLWADDAKKPDVPGKGFFVHEWGVWRIHDDIDLANADRRAEWDALPEFVYGQTTNRDFPHYWDATNVYKPVIFFHAPGPMKVEASVDFPTGVPAVWWPATQNPAHHDYTGFVPSATKPQGPIKKLAWTLELKPSKPPVAELKPVNKAHWMNALRNVKCDDVYVPVGERGAGIREREKFVYYDGLLPRFQVLAVKVEKDKVELKNQKAFAVDDVWVIDNRDDAAPRVGRLPRLKSDEAKVVDLTVMKEARWADDAAKALTAQLKAAGLYEDEAASLTTIWSADFFHSPGVTLFFRLPEEEYNRLLPLSVWPWPEKTVRVGLIQQVPNEPGMAERVARLVKQLDDDEFDKREAAQQELAKLGPSAFGYLKRLQPKITALEAKRRLEELLEKHDARQLLPNK